jgi:Ca2+-binding EF-hand superfamily protein
MLEENYDIEEAREMIHILKHMMNDQEALNECAKDMMKDFDFDKNGTLDFIEAT